ncbi:hypothetical protein Sjap_026622 [Stephania japonica]|uniref:Uncharacterized protein n=1 Tax=Stephania japonica TaxID=461633 RepID=A0AAP0DUN9_9MAGN
MLRQEGKGLHEAKRQPLTDRLTWATLNPGILPPLTYSWLAFLPCYECSLPSPTHLPLFSFLASLIVLSFLDAHRQACLEKESSFLLHQGNCSTSTIPIGMIMH